MVATDGGGNVRAPYRRYSRVCHIHSSPLGVVAVQAVKAIYMFVGSAATDHTASPLKRGHLGQLGEVIQHYALAMEQRMECCACNRGDSDGGGRERLMRRLPAIPNRAF